MAMILNTAAQMMCPHGGMVTAISSNTATRAGGAFALRAGDTFTIAGCILNVAGAPHPCVTVEWVVTAQQGKAVGDVLLTTDSTGLCKAADQAVQGTVMIVASQPKVGGR